MQGAGGPPNGGTPQVISSLPHFYAAISQALENQHVFTTSWKLVPDNTVSHRNKSYLIFESNTAALESVTNDFDHVWHNYYDIKPELRFPDAYVIVLKLKKWTNYGEMIVVGTCNRLVTTESDTPATKTTNKGWVNEWQKRSFNAERPLSHNDQYFVSASLQKLSREGRQFAVPLDAIADARYWEQRNGMFRFRRSTQVTLPEARQAVVDLWASLPVDRRPRPRVDNGNGYYIQVKALLKRFDDEIYDKQLIAHSIAYVGNPNGPLNTWKTVRNPAFSRAYIADDESSLYFIRVSLLTLTGMPLRIPLEDLNLHKMLPNTPNLQFLLTNFLVQAPSNYETVMVDDLSDEAWSGNVSEVSDALLSLLVA